MLKDDLKYKLDIQFFAGEGAAEGGDPGTGEPGDPPVDPVPGKDGKGAGQEDPKGGQPKGQDDPPKEPTPDWWAGLGFDSLEAATESLKAAKEFSDSQKTASEKAAEKAAEAEKRASGLEAQLDAMKLQTEALKLGVRETAVSDVINLANAKSKNGKATEKEIKAILEAYPNVFTKPEGHFGADGGKPSDKPLTMHSALAERLGSK